MGYSNDFTGEITITPPLTWAEIQTSPPLRDRSLRLVEAITDTETGRTIATQAISVSVESGFSGFNAVEEIQALVDHHGATHTFAGHIDAQFEIGLVEAGQPGCERYVVRDGRVETLTPRLVWPGEDSELLADARALAILYRDVLKELPHELSGILDVEWEELPDWFTGDNQGREMWGGGA